MTLEGLKAWAGELLKHCEAKGIHCIAVTDHHDLFPGLVVLSIGYENKSPVWVFPGMEITSACGLQGILLLDPALFGNQSTFDLKGTEVVANKVFATLGQDISAHKGIRSLELSSWRDLENLKDLPEEKRREVFVSPQSDRVDKNFEGPDGIASNLERSFRNQYLLLPNLEKNSHGVFGNDNGRTLCLKANGWLVGGIVGGGNPTNEQAIKGQDAAYGGRILTCVRTSDQRGQDDAIWFGDRLGATECVSWLKLSDCTTTSIAQALISGDGRRVFQAKPNESGDRIERLAISGTDVFGSASIEWQFSPNLNTLIGGRGSGKSLVLSALVRLFAIDREWAAKGERTMWEERHLALFAAGGPFAGPDASLSVEYVKESGVRYRLTIDAPGEPLIESSRLEMWSGGSWSKVAEGDAVLATADFHPLFFLQGQMSSMTGSRLDQYDLIRLIEGPLRESRQKLRDQLGDLTGFVREGLQQKRQKIQLEVKVRQLIAQAKQKEEERKAFLEAAKKGLKEEQQKLFEGAETYRKGKTSAQTLEDALSSSATAINGAIEDLESAINSTSDSIKKLQSSSSRKFSADAYLAALVDSSAQLLKELKGWKKKADEDNAAIALKKVKFLHEIDALIGKANEFAEKERSRKTAILKAANLEKEIDEISKQKSVAEQEIVKIARSGKIENGESALVQFKDVVKDYSNKFKDRANAISANPDFRLVVRVIPGGMYQGFLGEMKSVCQGCGIREKTWLQLEQTLQESADPASKITELISSAAAAFGEWETATIPPVWSECGFTEATFANVLTRTQLENWLELSAVLADDKVEVRYKKGAKKPPIPILSASPGERAVELLKLALFSTRGPLIIDQPEDDLDNHFLADKLVELVHQSKHTNQLIFASHNANLVVHGDAELIHVLSVVEVSEGKVGCSLADSGTIDQQEICLAIERVMEGGRGAFEYRRRKYHETVDPMRLIGGS